MAMSSTHSIRENAIYIVLYCVCVCVCVCVCCNSLEKQFSAIILVVVVGP